MLTPRLRRRRHALDTYVHAELEQRRPLAENASVRLLRETSEATSEAAGEKPIARARAS